MLNVKQERFVAEYLIDLNATAAARRAGYRQPHVQGPRLLSQEAVTAAVTLAQKERAERTRLSADWVIDRLRAEALNIKHGSQTGRVRALELLGKHLGLFKERVEISTPKQMEITEVIVRNRQEAKDIIGAAAALGMNLVGFDNHP